MNLASPRDHRRLELLQKLRQPPHHLRLDLAGRLSQLLPIGQLGDPQQPLGADRRQRMPEIASQLPILERVVGSLGERAVPLDLTGAVRHPDHGAHTNTAGCSRVAIRISARCKLRAAALARLSPEPICIKQDASAAVTNSAPVEVIIAILSASIAEDVSAFFTQKVPPNPQHCSADGNSTT